MRERVAEAATEQIGRMGAEDPANIAGGLAHLRAPVLSVAWSSTTAVMWQVRWKYSCAMLRLTGRRRLNVGPSSISSCFRTRSSRFKLKLCSAFAAADLIALATSRAACFGENSRYARASVTFMPLTESATSLALRGVRRTNF